MEDGGKATISALQPTQWKNIFCNKQAKHYDLFPDGKVLEKT